MQNLIIVQNNSPSIFTHAKFEMATSLNKKISTHIKGKKKDVQEKKNLRIYLSPDRSQSCFALSVLV